jgi:LacI family transcriptional regulator
MAVVNRYHYVPHGLAGALASRRSRQIGIIIPTIANSIYGCCTQAVNRVAQRAGYTVLVGISEFSPEHEAEIIHRFLERRVEGLILTGMTRACELYKKIEHNGVRFVVTWKYNSDRARPAVSFDNYKAAAMAVEHLISLGHRRIGLICGRADVNDRALERRRSFEETMRAHGIEPDPELIFEREFEFSEGRDAVATMLQHERPPTALFIANDVQAVGALLKCREMGLSVPEDLSIVGFDDLPITQYVNPPLTTVRVPSGEMGRLAAEHLISAIQRGQPVKSVELSTCLVVRGSTGPARTSSIRRARRRQAARG